jgi:hypothetical protein
MQNSCENLFRGICGTLYITSRVVLELQFRARAGKRFPILSMGAMNTAKSAFFMRRREKTVAPRPEAGNRMLYSIRRRLTRDIPSFFQILALQGAGNTLYST